MCIDHFEVKKETLFEKYQNININSAFSLIKVLCLIPYQAYWTLSGSQACGLRRRTALVFFAFSKIGTVPVP